MGGYFSFWTMYLYLYRTTISSLIGRVDSLFLGEHWSLMIIKHDFKKHCLQLTPHEALTKPTKPWMESCMRGFSAVLDSWLHWQKFMFWLSICVLTCKIVPDVRTKQKTDQITAVCFRIIRPLTLISFSSSLRSCSICSALSSSSRTVWVTTFSFSSSATL